MTYPRLWCWFRQCLVLASALIFSVALHAQDQYFDSDGVQIRYVEKGTGEPVVLIHGYGSNIETNWVQPGVLDALATNYHVIALDLRGHGKSGKPHDSALYGVKVSEDVVRLLDHLKLAKAHVIGYSYGGITVAKLLATHPERFTTAVLGGHSGRRGWSAADDEAVAKEVAELEGEHSFRSVILRTWPSNQPPPTPEQIQLRSRLMNAVNDPLAIAAMARARSQEVVTNAQLIKAGVPTQGIVGSADAYLSGFQALQQAWPAFTLIVIDGATHSGDAGAMKRPEFLQAIRSFLQQHPAH